MASCVGVLSWSNSPLFVRSRDPERDLADQYALHTSLDVIEEKTSASLTLHAVANKKAIEQQTRELYLGVLFATEKQKVPPPDQWDPPSLLEPWEEEGGSFGLQWVIVWN